MSQAAAIKGKGSFKIKKKQSNIIEESKEEEDNQSPPPKIKKTKNLKSPN